MSEPSLRRYTNLASTLHILQNRHLTLLSPRNWDDRNDAFFMDELQARTAAKSVLALCFAQANETYHHWRVFSGGSDGICLAFDKTKLEEALRKNDRIVFRTVKYKTITAARTKRMADFELPFVKRYAYKDEKEFRILYLDMDEKKEFERIKISLNWINRITLSPWMPAPLASAVKSTLKGIRGCQRLRVYRSTLVDNERWKRIANPDLKMST